MPLSGILISLIDLREDWHNGDTTPEFRLTLAMGETATTLPGTTGSEAAGELFAGRYRIKRRLGQGGMGTVLLAHHEALDQDVAIKVLAPELARDSEFVLRLTREARAVAKLRSEHVVRVTDVDTLDGVGPYMVMEFLRGRSLAQEAAARGPLPVAEVVKYVLEALEAVAEAHELGIVHRDLKPSNIFLASRADGTRCVKVLDFGISKVEFLSEPTLHLTSSQVLLGTPLYMSPEQFRSAKDVDARADVWSIGVVMYQLLTGTTPFQGSTAGEVCFAIVETTPKPIRAFRKDVPPALERTVLRCLQKEPSQRFADANALLRALAQFRQPGARAAREATRGMLIAGMCVALGLLIAVWLAWRSASPAPQAAGPTLDSAARQPEIATVDLSKTAMPIPETPKAREPDVEPLPSPIASSPRPSPPPARSSPPRPARLQPASSSPPPSGLDLDLRH